jgi:hypothetical protein
MTYSFFPRTASAASIRSIREAFPGSCLSVRPGAGRWPATVAAGRRRERQQTNRRFKITMPVCWLTLARGLPISPYVVGGERKILNEIFISSRRRLKKLGRCFCAAHRHLRESCRYLLMFRLRVSGLPNEVLVYAVQQQLLSVSSRWRHRSFLRAELDALRRHSWLLLRVLVRRKERQTHD